MRYSDNQLLPKFKMGAVYVALMLMAFCSTAAISGENSTPNADATFEDLMPFLDQEKADVQFAIGTVYRLGQGGMPQDSSKAAEWFRKAADQGHAMAQNDLGRLYMNGEGVPKDYEQAAQWLRKAAEQDIDIAQYNLSVMYFNGAGVPQDYKQGMHWLKKAAEQGHAGAQCELGIQYIIEEGTPQDLRQAIIWLAKASEQGDKRAEQALQLLKDNIQIK